MFLTITVIHKGWSQIHLSFVGTRVLPCFPSRFPPFFQGSRAINSVKTCQNNEKKIINKKNNIEKSD